MKIKFLALTLILFFMGCAPLLTSQTPDVSSTTPAIDPSQSPDVTEQIFTPDMEDKPAAGSIVPVETQDSATEQQDPEEIEKGTFFAKTEFYGVLKANYVQFLINDLGNPNSKFNLHIGEKPLSVTFPWETKVVQPGYFFIELPPGHYKITNLSIPVGTTMATEDINIYFNVEAQKTTYGGTLKVVGTKERIKLGGVPVIKPGFEYVAEVLNQQDEGLQTYLSQFPEREDSIKVDLMRVDPIAK
ncbi:MAG: hypothetical protein K8S27_14210 [Candidatus Omnitrophica bacterium]|nr:hypothetical protein [Candidatus Omnitrophota bacterium]